MRTIQDQIKSLAVRYHAYMTAKDIADIIIWGEMLWEAQAECGVELIEQDRIKDRVLTARIMENRERAA